MLLHEVIGFSARRAPSAVALVVDGRRWTFAELWADVQALAAWVAERTDRGDRVALVSDNRYEVVVALYAVPMAGAILMLGNTRLVPGEIAALIGDVGPSVLIGSAPQLDRLVPDGGSMATVRHVASFEEVWNDLGELHTTTAPATVDADASDTAWIIHTSGTTGRPKGAMLSHRSLLAAVLNTALCRTVADDEVYLFPFPLFHVAAYNVVHLHLRARTVVLVEKFDAVAVMTATEAEHVTSMSLAPTMIAMLLDHAGRQMFDLGSLRSIFYGASAVPIGVLRRGLGEFGCEFSQGYGMTELSGNAVFLDPVAHRRAVSGFPQLLGAAGRPGPLVDVRLVSIGPEAGADQPSDGVLIEVGPGEPGEIVVRGDQVIDRYWGQASATEPGRTDGWFHTGDIGRFDDEGYLYIVDRRKDLIVSGGENVSSLEVEAVMSQHPSIAQVAVVGVPHDTWGEVVVAVVVAQRSGSDGPDTMIDADGVLQWARGRLAGFKRPKELVVVDSLPVNASGKVLKREVRARAVAQLRPDRS